MNANLLLSFVILAACSPKSPPLPPETPPEARNCPNVVSGLVSTDGQAIVGATVAAIEKRENTATMLATSIRGGLFTLCLPDGEFSITATAPGFTSVFSEPRPIEELSRSPIQLRMAVSDTFIETSIEVGNPFGLAHLRAVRRSNLVGDVFYFPIEPRTDSIRLGLPGGFEYRLDVEGEAKALPARVDLRSKSRESATLRLVSVKEIKADPPQDLLNWIRKTSISLSSTSPESTDVDDLRKLATSLDGVQIVGFGENSHGAREFFELRHRFLRFAAKELGFVVFALEVGFAEGLAIDRYVQGGEGNIEELLTSLDYWTWDILEIEETFRWMRHYNTSKPPPQRPLRFYGIDMQYSTRAYRNIREFAENHSKELALQLSRADALADEEYVEYRTLSEEQRTQLCEATARTIEVIERNKGAFATTVGSRELNTLRQNATVLHQSCLFYVAKDRAAFRDQSMAANARWIQTQEGPSAKIVLWAHNNHILRTSDGWSRPMGSFLSKALGKKYFAIGQFFQDGEVRAWDMREKDRKKRSVLPIKIEPSRFGLSRSLALVGPSQFFLSLRAAQAKGDQGWLSTPSLERSFSAQYSEKSEEPRLYAPSTQFDGLVFIRTVTPTRPKESGLRGPNSR